jgi:predicted site-specific integrase-resolvase
MEKDVYISANKITKQFDITSNTLRKWADDGKIRCLRPNSDNKTGGKRIYHTGDIQKIFGVKEELKERKIICYARVSSNHQKEDLKRQVDFLKETYQEADIIKDIGSGLNWNRVGFKSLLEQVYSGDVKTVVVSYKDRLCRFGIELVEWIFKKSDVKLLVLSKSPGEQDMSRELSEDLLAITTVFVAKNNGLRAAKYRRERKQRELDSQESNDLPNEGTKTNN